MMPGRKSLTVCYQERSFTGREVFIYYIIYTIYTLFIICGTCRTICTEILGQRIWLPQRTCCLVKKSSTVLISSQLLCGTSRTRLGRKAQWCDLVLSKTYRLAFVIICGACRITCIAMQGRRIWLPLRPCSLVKTLLILNQMLCSTCRTRLGRKAQV
jgi:hypothetical protein